MDKEIKETEQDLVRSIKRYRYTLLNKIKGEIWNRYSENPIEDQTDIDEAYEKGLRDAVGIVESYRL